MTKSFTDFQVSTIEEITLVAYSMGIYDFLFEKENMSRDNIFSLFREWGIEFEKAHENYEWDGDYYDEIDAFLENKFKEIRLKDIFSFDVNIGDYFEYDGGLYRITGFTNGGVCVDELRKRPNVYYSVTEISYSLAERFKFIDGKDFMDTTNGHNENYVRLLNEAWNTKREQFYLILCALYTRDAQEILDSEAFGYLNVNDHNLDYVIDYMHENWDVEAYNYAMHIADDNDLKVILGYLGYNV